MTNAREPAVDTLEKPTTNKVRNRATDATAVLKAVVLATVVLFALVHWNFFSDWLSSVTHLEGFGLKVDRAAVNETIRKIADTKKETSLPFLADSARIATNVQSALTDARVLWIDPNPTNNVLPTLFLNQVGVNVQAALSAEDALSVLQEEPVDLVISNIGRPPANAAPMTLKACKAFYTVVPYGATEANDDKGLAEFNAQLQQNPPIGFRIAEALAFAKPELFADHTAPRIIFFSSGSGSKTLNECARLSTNRYDVLLSAVITTLAQLRAAKLEDKSVDQPKEKASSEKVSGK